MWFLSSAGKAKNLDQIRKLLFVLARVDVHLSWNLDPSSFDSDLVSWGPSCRARAFSLALSTLLGLIRG